MASCLTEEEVELAFRASAAAEYDVAGGRFRVAALWMLDGALSTLEPTTLRRAWLDVLPTLASRYRGALLLDLGSLGHTLQALGDQALSSTARAMVAVRRTHP